MWPLPAGTEVGCLPMPSPPRLCFIWTSPDLLHFLLGEAAPIGGAEVQLRKLGRRLHDMGWDISFVVSDCGQGDAVVNEDGFTLYSSYPFRRIVPVADILATKMPRVSAAMRRADADVFVQRGAAWLTGYCAVAAHRMQRRFVFWMASLNDAMSGANAWQMPAHVRVLFTHGLRNADLIVAQTQEQASLVAGRYHRSAVVLPNICPVPTHAPIKDEAPTVLWVGNLASRKRPGLLLEIARLCPDLGFTMVGGPFPGEEALYERIAAEAADIPNVRFLGSLRPEGVEALYGRAWLLVSTSHTEGFSNAFLQAWAFGTPVVAYLDPDEVICRHQLGYHCSSAGEMAERVRQLGADRALRAQIGVNARDYVRKHHAPDVVMPQLDAQLRSLVRPRGALGAASGR
jgi:glycosyltransferase involved in cell wall biosynthesis